jgi:hypothetical protein
MTETESPCDFHCGYVSSGRDLWEHIAWEHQDCGECGNSPRHDEAGNEAVTHKPDCPRLQPGYAYPSAGSGYTRYDGPLEGDDDPYVNDVIGDLT